MLCLYLTNNPKNWGYMSTGPRPSFSPSALGCLLHHQHSSEHNLSQRPTISHTLAAPSPVITAVLKEYSSLQDNHYNARYIHTVLIVHNYFAPRGIVNILTSESSYCSAHALGHTHINDITGPAAGLAWADKLCL